MLLNLNLNRSVDGNAPLAALALGSARTGTTGMLQDGAAKTFYQSYAVVHARTAELQMECFRLRYLVYCQQKGFEPLDACRADHDANGNFDYYETDEFDDRSCHFLIRHKATSSYVATVRLICCAALDRGNELPLEKHCPSALSDIASRQSIGEVSRFAISATRLTALRDSALPSIMCEPQANSDTDLTTRRLLTPGLLSCLVRASRLSGVKRWYGLMEPSFIRLLTSLGIELVRIGPAVSFRGTRIPCRAVLDDVLLRLKHERPEAWSILTEFGRFA